MAWYCATLAAARPDFFRPPKSSSARLVLGATAREYSGPQMQRRAHMDPSEKIPPTVSPNSLTELPGEKIPPTAWPNCLTELQLEIQLCESTS